MPPSLVLRRGMRDGHTYTRVLRKLYLTYIGSANNTSTPKNKNKKILWSIFQK